jgi:hypothetical protein
MTEKTGKCLTQEECKRIIIAKCLKGNLKACQVIKKTIKNDS